MRWSPVLAVSIAAIVFVAGAGLRAQQAPPPAATCTITGTITGLGGPLPGVSITIRRGDAVQTAASTDIDGTFKLTVPDASYQLTAELTGFEKVQKDITIGKDACAQQTVDLTMALTPRVARAAAPAGPAAPEGRAAGAGRRGGGAGARGGGAVAANETAEAAAQRRFESLTVNENEATRSLEPSAFESGGDASGVIAAGFGNEALADAFAVTGEAARVDRGLLNDRRGADFLPPDFDPRNFPGGFAGLEGAIAEFQGRGGRQGGNPNFQGRGGPGGPGGPGREGGNPNFQGRAGGRGNNPNFRNGQRVQGTATYNFSGSALNSAPRQLRSEVKGVEPRNANHNYNFSTQIPLKIPGLYKDTNNRTMMTITYSGRTGTNPFDQYATVPTDAMRAGDFSNVSTPLIDPSTGQPFLNNQIPVERLSPQALALLQYYPAATLPGTTRNYHRATTTFQRQNQVQLRLQHNFTPQAGGRGGRGGFQGGGGVAADRPTRAAVNRGVARRRAPTST